MIHFHVLNLVLVLFRATARHMSCAYQLFSCLCSIHLLIKIKSAKATETTKKFVYIFLKGKFDLIQTFMCCKYTKYISSVIFFCLLMI